MEGQVKECIEEFKKSSSEEGAAKLIICLINNKESIYWDESKKRLKVAAEVYDNRWPPLMKSVTKALGVKSKNEYTKMKYKYNLTQY